MKADGLRDLSQEELANREQELREQLLKLRFQQSTGQIESPQMLRSVRKDIARVLTVLRERSPGGGATAGSGAATGGGEVTAQTPAES